jgi:hypothetical protein
MSKMSYAAAGNYDLEKALLELDGQGGQYPLTTGNVYVVIPASDSNYVEFVEKYQKTYLDGTEMVHTTVASAYAAVTSNRHDVILLSANAAHAQTSMLSVAKSRVHFIGLGYRPGSIGMGARARMTMGVTTAATDLGVMQNTGVGNTFQGIKFDSENTKAESIYSVVEAGEYAIYEGCEFYKSTDLDVTGAAEVANNGDSAQWINCTFGSSANIIADNVIRPNMLLTGGIVSGAKMRDNVVRDCLFLSKSGGTEHVAIYGANATDVERMLLIKNSTFLNNTLSAALPAHMVGFGAAQTEGTVLLQDCVSVDSTVMAQASVGIYVAGAVPTFATTGVAVAA